MALIVEKKKTYVFLGVDVKPNGKGCYTMTQEGLVKKVLKTTGMEGSNRKTTFANATFLGIDEHEKLYKENWNYASVIGMLLYLSSKTRQDIQFSVHQCARFIHNPRSRKCY